jgi:serine/threonine-protein kinase
MPVVFGGVDHDLAGALWHAMCGLFSNIMPQLSLTDFLDVVERSGLVDKAQLSQTLSAVETDHAAAPSNAEASDTQLVCSRLAQAGLLTDWQGQQLLEGRYRGFFLGKYKMLDQLGSGGMGSVFLAEHVDMRRRVAIKVLSAIRVHDTSYLGRFHREARAAAALDHPNIARAFDVGNDGDIHYLVMEYIAGRDLHSIVARDGPLDFVTAADYIRQTADGLAHAHRAGLVHRDIKPANLLVDAVGTVKILDLGLARFDNDDQASLTRQFDEKVLGTVDFLAPEQAIDSHLVDARADIYSLGCTLYFALTGHPPFPTGTLAQRVLWHQTREPRRLELERAGTPRQLAAICRRMMAKSPSGRYQSTDDVRAALSNWLEAARRPATLSSTVVCPQSLDDEPLTLAPLDDGPERRKGSCATVVPAVVLGSGSVAIAVPDLPIARAGLTSTATLPRPDDWLNDLPAVKVPAAPSAVSFSPVGRRSRQVDSAKSSDWDSVWFLIGMGTMLGLLIAAMWLVVRALLN